MSSLKDKIENALNESRTLILGVEVLLGFEYDAYFQGSFDKLPSFARNLRVASLCIMLVALGLLMLPAAYHRVVSEGEDTDDLNDFTSRVTGIALLPFSLGLTLDIYVAAGVVAGFSPAVIVGVIVLVISLFLWYGLEFIERNRHRDEAGREKKMSHAKQDEEHSGTQLSEKIKQVLTETRIVLPGAQALLGFQLTIVLTQKFDQLTDLQQRVHLLSLLSIAICTALLMAPAAYHRIVEDGEDTLRFQRFASSMVLAALVFLALGLAGDLEVIVYEILASSLLAWGSAALALAFFYGLWFGFTTLRRSQVRQI